MPMTPEQHAAYCRILERPKGRFVLSNAPQLPGQQDNAPEIPDSAFSGPLKAAPPESPPAADFAPPAPCEYCGRSTDCRPCEHCSFKGDVAEAVRTVLEPGRAPDAKRLSALHLLAGDGSWHANELVKHRVVKAAANIVGRAGAEAMFRAKPPDGDTWSGAFKLLGEIDVDDELPPLARGLAWPYRTTIVHGPAGSGKTRCLAAAAAALSNGDMWAGVSTEATVCLWIAYEDIGGAARLLKHHGANPAGVVLGPGHSLIADMPGRFAQLVEQVQPAWVIVDSLASMAAALGVDTNSADEVTTALEPFNAAAAAGAAVTLTHHEPHAEERTRNSTGIQAAVDALMRVTHDPDDSLTTIAKGTKVRFGMEHETAIYLQLAQDGASFVRLGRAPSRLEQYRAPVLAALRENPNADYKTCAEKADYKKNSRTWKAFTDLVDECREDA